jgi:predicted ABC-type ATPase
LGDKHGSASQTFDNPEESIKRVAMRVSQGGHDVPDEKLTARFKRTQENLKRAVERLPYVIVFSNDDLTRPYKIVELYENGKSILNL